jgi:hypothetical protein
LRATLNSTVPLAAPLAPEVIMIQLTSVAAVQEQLEMTSIRFVPPVFGTLTRFALNDMVQLEAIWVRVNVWEPMTMLPVRGCDEVFAVTL